jgi:hypothetical protein
MYPDQVPDFYFFLDPLPQSTSDLIQILLNNTDKKKGWQVGDLCKD